MRKIKVIIKRPDELFGHVTNISDELHNLQKTVEGPIEVVNLGDIVLIVNEMGKLRELPPNFPLGDDMIVGTVIACGTYGEELVDVPITFQEWKDRMLRWTGWL